MSSLPLNFNYPTTQRLSPTRTLSTLSWATSFSAFNVVSQHRSLWRPSPAAPIIPRHMLLRLRSVWRGCHVTGASHLSTARRQHSRAAPQRPAPCLAAPSVERISCAPSPAASPSQNQGDADVRAALRLTRACPPLPPVSFPLYRPRPRTGWACKLGQHSRRGYHGARGELLSQNPPCDPLPRRYRLPWPLWEFSASRPRWRPPWLQQNSFGKP